jgi:hypothetical protein
MLSQFSSQNREIGVTKIYRNLECHEPLSITLSMRLTNQNLDDHKFPQNFAKRPSPRQKDAPDQAGILCHAFNSEGLDFYISIKKASLSLKKFQFLKSRCFESRYRMRSHVPEDYSAQYPASTMTPEYTFYYRSVKRCM